MTDKLTTPLLSKKSDEYELSDFKIQGKNNPRQIPTRQPNPMPSMNPNLAPRQPSINRQIPQPGVQQSIPCAGCKTPLGYPTGAYCVKCPHCSTLTAVQEIAQLGCPYCKQIVVFPRTAPFVKCTCGCLFRNQFAGLV